MPKLLFFVTEDWYFYSHRLPIAEAAIKAGYEVVLLANVNLHGELIEGAGVRVIPLALKRRCLNPFQELKTLYDVIAAYRRERPDIVHHVAMKPVLYGSVAAWLTGISRVVNAMAGMGYLFISDSLKALLLRNFVTRIFRVLLNAGDSRLIIQNPDDGEMFVVNNLVESKRIRLIKGSGVDVMLYRPQPEPDLPVTIILPSRMLWDKGVGEFVEASKLLKQRGITARFVLVGKTDPENPSSIREATIRDWVAAGVVEWWGHRDDMHDVFPQAHVVCLPSYREGLPKALLEAAACGRPIVATDVPGCREIARHRENGLLVPVKDGVALADALQDLIENPDLRLNMGKRGQEIAEREFSVEKVVSDTLAVYEELLAS
jgi:glycosyltransferase involved in cell wall biosynthesis